VSTGAAAHFNWWSNWDPSEGSEEIFICTFVLKKQGLKINFGVMSCEKIA
jgi:hypothetical protein